MVTFTNKSNPIGESNTWNFGDGTIITENQPTITHTFLTENCFDIQLTITKDGCSSTKIENNMICAYANAIADFEIDKMTSTIINPTFYFTNTSSNSTIYKWYLSDGTNSIDENINHTFPSIVDNYSITLIANNIHNCPDQITKNIEIKDELLFYIPNAFTPDDDNANPNFTPIFSGGLNPNEFTMLIFNRWGEIIFETHDSSKGWTGKYGIDGEICQDDVYVWKISFTDSIENKRHVNTGHVSLLR